MSNQGGPDAAPVGSAEEEEEPERRHHEAEHGHEHHPAQRVVWNYAGRRHQDPHQTSENLQGHTGEAKQFLLAFSNSLMTINITGRVLL